jgi:hypothetical protein
MTDYGKPHRAALIAGTPAPRLSNEAKVAFATKQLGERHILQGAKPDWSRPTILPQWIAGRPGAFQRIAGC